MELKQFLKVPIIYTYLTVVRPWVSSSWNNWVESQPCFFQKLALFEHLATMHSRESWDSFHLYSFDHRLPTYDLVNNLRDLQSRTFGEKFYTGNLRVVEPFTLYGLAPKHRFEYLMPIERRQLERTLLRIYEKELASGR